MQGKARTRQRDRFVGVGADPAGAARGTGARCLCGEVFVVGYEINP